MEKPVGKPGWNIFSEMDFGNTNYEIRNVHGYNIAGDTATEREGWNHYVDRMDKTSDGRNHTIITKMWKDKGTLAGELFRFIQGLNCLLVKKKIRTGPKYLRTASQQR